MDMELRVNSLHAGKIFSYFYLQLILISGKSFWNTLECQMDWILIRPDKLLGLIWVHTICKRYQLTIITEKSVKPYILKEESMFGFYEEVVGKRKNQANQILTLCMLGNFSCFCCRLDFFSKDIFSIIFFRNYDSVR